MKRDKALTVEMPIRGAVDIRCEGWVKPRRLVLWSLSTGDRMSESIVKAAGEYMRLFGGAPMYAFTRSLPRGIEPGRGIPFMGGEILLFNAEWIPGGSVAVGGWCLSRCE